MRIKLFIKMFSESILKDNSILNVHFSNIHNSSISRVLTHMFNKEPDHQHHKRSPLSNLDLDDTMATSFTTSILSHLYTHMTKLEVAKMLPR